MFGKLLAKIGLYTKEQLRLKIFDAELAVLEEQDFAELNYDEDTLSLMLAEKLGVQDEIDSDYEKKIFLDLKGTDGLVQYLREAAARDKDRYFGAASKEEQLVIRGAFARTMYLKAKIAGADDVKE